MGEAKRRWSVTYTKHVKQKRKVHQDGSMEVCRSSNGVEKATLYDEPGNVMVSRYLKREERVECGGTLDLGSHLVDVGDLEGGFDGVEGKGDVKSSNSNSIDTGECRMGKNGASEGSRNLFHNNRRGGISAMSVSKGNEAAEREKTGVSRNCHTATEISAKEWYALYTTQITQKAKKYQDGILRLEFRGSHGKQVMLYDSTRKVLNTRFLKKDEVVRSGETLVFDAHLVDVGEPKENNEGAAGSTGGQQKQKILRDFKKENNEGAPGTTGGQQKQNTPQDFKKEWHAMYTTQKTQKLKKYHDGILCLSVSICNQKQATLLNEDGAVLGSKYLNPAADIRTGNSLEITNYLINIGDPKMLHRADQQNHCSTQEGVSSFSSSFKLDRSHGGDNRSKGETKGSSLGKDRGSHSISSNVDERTADGNAKLIRDAHQILFTLKRPIAPPSSGPTNEPLSQPIDSLRSSQSQSTSQDKPSEHDMQHLNLFGKDSLQNSQVRYSSTMSTLGSNILHSKAAEDFADIEINNLSGEPKSNISLGCPEKSSPSSIAKCQVPDIIQHDMQARGPSGDDGKITNNDANENSNQHSADMVDDGRLGECKTIIFSIPCASASSHVNNVKGKTLEKKMNVREEKMKMNEFPSFDLGF